MSASRRAWLFCARARQLMWLALLALSAPAYGVSQITLQLDELRHPSVAARGVVLRLALQPAQLLELKARELTVKSRRWRDVALTCSRPSFSRHGRFDCPAGQLASAEGKLPVAFTLDTGQRTLSLVLTPAPQERWAADLRWQDAQWQAEARVERGQLARLAGLLPLALTRGALTAQASMRGDGQGLAAASGTLDLADAAFNNADGSLAAEALAGTARVAARRRDAHWDWQLATDWKAGELYRQPLYFARGGHRLEARGRWDDAHLAVDQAQLALGGVGRATLAGRYAYSTRTLEALQLDAPDLDAAQLYPLLLKPYLERTLLADLEVAGQAGLQLDWRGGELQAFKLALREFDLDDSKGRFGFYKVNAQVPWTLNQASVARLRYAGGHLLKLPLGRTELAARLDGYSLTAGTLMLPVLDGVLSLNDVSAALLNRQWHWHLSAQLSPVAMREFSHAVGWPSMDGQVAASIPMVTYSGGNMTVDGAMRFNVFDGTVEVGGLKLQQPLGLAPRLAADVRMRNLDLGLLTRTFSFGAMTGRLDGDVLGLELSRWQPVRFDADIRSSPGRYPRKISQRAVENISALGGAGAAAAIQRSFLRFFDEFHYAAIGLSCRLRNGVCEMDGIEPAQGGYVIVKGSGIPAITVLGYNRSVSWGELLSRLKRITQGDATPVIK